MQAHVAAKPNLSQQYDFYNTMWLAATFTRWDTRCEFDQHQFTKVLQEGHLENVGQLLF